MWEKSYQPRCSSCPYNLSYFDSIPQKKFGVMMHCGERFYTGGKRARRFKRNDSQIHVPQWCPKRKNPCELRIYALKSKTDWWTHDYLYRDAGKGFSVSAYRYALRYEGTIHLSPYEFWKQIDEEPYAGLLPVPVELYEVLEFDDGLKPVFFYKDIGDFRLVHSFDTGRARKNVTEENSNPSCQ